MGKGGFMGRKRMLRDEKGIVLRIIPINDRGELFIDKYEKYMLLCCFIIVICLGFCGSDTK